MQRPPFRLQAGMPDYLFSSEGILAGPASDLVVSSGQRIMIHDWRAGSLYGSDFATVPVARLADGAHVRYEITDLARVFALHFEREEVIYA